MRSNEPLTAGPLALRDSVKSALYALRHFSAYYEAADQLPPAAIEISAVKAVEEALDCCLPYEAIACLANNDGDLAEYGIAMGRVAENTTAARARGCSPDSIALGRHPDDHAFYCIAKQGPRSRGVQMTDLDLFDGGERSYDLAEWLSQHVERRQEFTSDDFPEVRDWVPSPQELAAFSIILIDD